MYIPTSGNVSCRYACMFHNAGMGLCIQILYVIVKDLEIIHTNLKSLLAFSPHICMKLDFLYMCEPKIT